MHRPKSRSNDDPESEAVVVHEEAGHILTPNRPIRILIVDDEHTIREGCATILGGEGRDVTVCGRGSEAQELLRTEPFDVVLLDLFMQGVSGLELMRTCRARSPDALVIMMTGKPSVDSSIECLRDGAWDYLVKPFSAAQLRILMGRAAHAVAVARESSHCPVYSPGEDPELARVMEGATGLQRVLEQARRVAPSDAAVFITGESGTGKELLARYIHRRSRRRSRPFVPVNCATLPERAPVSELFDLEGAVGVGARREGPAPLAITHGGTLFLDFLTGMPLDVQAKVLRVIQEGAVSEPVGDRLPGTMNVRFITATNEDPQESLQTGDLRRDLYYRLRVVPLHLPPLRERVSDVPAIARHFLTRCWERHGHGRTPPVLGDEAIRELQGRPWPGNLRELRNLIEHTAVLMNRGETITPAHLPKQDGGGEAHEVEQDDDLMEGFLDEDFHTARDRLLAEFEKRYLFHMVRRANGNMSEAARLAGVDRTTLFRIRRKHNLDRDDLLEQRPPEA